MSMPSSEDRRCVARGAGGCAAGYVGSRAAVQALEAAAAAAAKLAARSEALSTLLALARERLEVRPVLS